MVKDKEILQGLKCPYCGAPSELTDSSEVYKKSYGMIRICRPCKAYIGCDATGKAVGRLANKELRAAKKAARAEIDKMAVKLKRRHVWSILKLNMGIMPALLNINYFDVEECKEVIKVLNP